MFKCVGENHNIDKMVGLCKEGQLINCLLCKRLPLYYRRSRAEQSEGTTTIVGIWQFKFYLAANSLYSIMYSDFSQKWNFVPFFFSFFTLLSNDMSFSLVDLLFLKIVTSHPKCTLYDDDENGRPIDSLLSYLQVAV